MKEETEYTVALVDRRGSVIKGARTFIKYKAQQWFAELGKEATYENGYIAYMTPCE